MRVIDAVLQADGALVALRATVHRDRLSRRQGADVAAAGQITSAGPVRAVPQLDAPAELVASADQSTALLEWLEAENAGALTAENMLGELRRVTATYLTQPIAPLFSRTESIRARAVRLLQGHQRPQVTRQLYAAAG